MNYLLIVLSLITVVSSENTCKENGLFPNTEDKTSFFRCKDGNAVFMRCPESEDGVSYLVFNGTDCVSESTLPTKSIIRSECSLGTFYDKMSGNCIPEEEDPSEEDSSEEDSSEEDSSEEDDKENNYSSTNNPNIERYVVPSREITCPFGSYYESKTGQCIKEYFVDPIKPKDMTKSDINCPFGTIYDKNSRKKRCRQVIEPQTQISCLPGSFYDSSIGKCRREETVEPIVESVPTHPICPTDTTYDVSRRKCLRVDYRTPIITVNNNVKYDTVCPNGYTYDPSREKCYSVSYIPTLPNEPTYTYKCPNGYTYDFSTQKCRTHRLVPPIQRSRCQPEYRYDPIRDKCIGIDWVNPIQNTRTIYACLPGYTYDPSIHKCKYCKEIDKPIYESTCPPTFVYDPSRDKCTKTILTEPLRPLPGCYCPRVDPCVQEQIICRNKVKSWGRFRRNGQFGTIDERKNLKDLKTWYEQPWTWNKKGPKSK